MIQDNISLEIEEDFFSAVYTTHTSPALFKIKFYIQQNDLSKVKSIRCIFQNENTFNKSFSNNFFNSTKNNKSYVDSDSISNSLLYFYKKNIKENFIISRNENTSTMLDENNVFYEIENSEFLYSGGFLSALIPLNITSKVKNNIKNGYIRVEFISELDDILFKTDFIEINFEEVYRNRSFQPKLPKLFRSIITSLGTDTSVLSKKDYFIKKIPSNVDRFLTNQLTATFDNIKPNFDKVNKTINFLNIFDNVRKLPVDTSDFLTNQFSINSNNIKSNFDTKNSSVNNTKPGFGNTRKKTNKIIESNIKINSKFNSYNKNSKSKKNKIEVKTKDSKEKTEVNKENSSLGSSLLSELLSTRSILISKVLEKKDSSKLNKSEDKFIKKEKLSNIETKVSSKAGNEFNKSNKQKITNKKSKNNKDIEIEISVKVGNEFNDSNKRKSRTVKKKIKIPANNQIINNIVKSEKSVYMKKNILDKFNMYIAFDFIDKNVGVIVLESLPLEDYYDFMYINMFEGIAINKKKNAFKLYSSPTFSKDNLIEPKDKKHLLSVFNKINNELDEKGRNQYVVYFDASKIYSIKDVDIQIDLIEDELKVTKNLKSVTDLKTKSFKSFKNDFINVVKKLNSIIQINLNKTILDFNTKKSNSLLYVESIVNNKPITELFNYIQILGFEKSDYLEKSDLIKSLLRESIVYVEIETIIANKKFEIKDAFLAGKKISFDKENFKIDLSYINETYNEYDFLQNLTDSEKQNYDFLFSNNKKILDIYNPSSDTFLEKKVKVLLFPIPLLFRRYINAGIDTDGNIVNKYSDENELNEVEKIFYDFIFSFNPNVNFFEFLSLKKEFFGIKSRDNFFYNKIKKIILDSNTGIQFKEIKGKLFKEDIFLEITSRYNITESVIKENKINILNEKRILEKISDISNITYDNKKLFNTRIIEGKFIKNFRDYGIYDLKEIEFSYNRLSRIRLEILSKLISEGFVFNKTEVNLYSCFIPVLTSSDILNTYEVNENEYTQLFSNDDFIKLIPNDEYFLTLDQQKNIEYFYGFDLVDFKLQQKDQISIKNEYFLQKNILSDFRRFFDECKKIKFNLLTNIMFIIKVDIDLEKDDKVYSKTYCVDLLDKSKKRIYKINNVKSIITKGFK